MSSAFPNPEVALKTHCLVYGDSLVSLVVYGRWTWGKKLTPLAMTYKEFYDKHLSKEETAFPIYCILDTVGGGKAKYKFVPFEQPSTPDAG